MFNAKNFNVFSFKYMNLSTCVSYDLSLKCHLIDGTRIHSIKINILD